MSLTRTPPLAGKAMPNGPMPPPSGWNPAAKVDRLKPWSAAVGVRTKLPCAGAVRTAPVRSARAKHLRSGATGTVPPRAAQGRVGEAVGRAAAGWRQLPMHLLSAIEHLLGK